MFRVFTTFLLSLTLFGSFATPAEARRGLVPVESLSYVSDFGETGKVLCHWVEHLTFKRIPLTAESRGYAVTYGSCETDAFTPLSEEEVLEAQANGLISSELPISPRLSKAQIFMNVVIWGGIGTVVVGTVLLNLGLFKKRRKAVEGSALMANGLTSLRGPKKPKPMKKDAVTKALAAMCHIAKCDGSVEGDEVMAIAKTIKNISGQSIPVAQIVAMISETPEAFDEDDYQMIAQGTSAEDCKRIFEAALSVAVSNGDIAQAEYSAVRSLAEALSIGADEFRASLDQIAGHLTVKTA